MTPQPHQQQPRSSSPDVLDERTLKRLLRSFTHEDLVEIVSNLEEIQEASAKLGPQTKWELWDYFKEKYGVELSTVAVCEGHTSQLDLVWEVYHFDEANILWVLARGSGKCLPGGALVYDVEAGREVTIDSLCDGRDVQVASLDSSGRVVAARAYGEPNIVKRCTRITTSSGRVVELSDDHPVLVAEGWIEAGDVEVDQKLAMPSVLPEPEWVVPFGDAEVDLLALLLAEGSYTQKSIGFSTGDEEILKIARVAADEFGCRVVHSQNYDYRIAHGKRVQNPVRDMLDRVGIGNELAKNKRVPKIFFKAPNEQIARFLEIFWMCDGYISPGPEITLASEGMIDDLRVLLLRLGIHSSVRRKTAKFDGKEYGSWRLTVMASSFHNFHRHIKLWGQKAEKMGEIMSRKSNPNKGRPVLPREFIERVESAIARMSLEERRDRGRDFSMIMGGAYRTLSRGHLVQTSRKTTSSARLMTMVSLLPEQDWSGLEMLWSDDIWWDDVVSVEDAGYQQTYDLCVPDHHNFVADGLFVHNTYLMAKVDETQADYFPGFTSFTIGPGKNQGERKYEHILPDVVEGGVIGGKEKEHIARSVMTKTEWKNTSSMEISLGGEPENANGPRTVRLHRDERELMKEVTASQAGGIPAGKWTRDGSRYMPSQIVDTSTMKWAGGTIDKLMEEYFDAINKGRRPRQQLRISCIFEAAKENPFCRSVPDDQRRVRLIELGLDPDQKCECNEYESGVFVNEDPDKEDEPRTLDKVCQGRFFRSRGYKEFGDITAIFNDIEPDTWEAEFECAQPARDGAYLKAYNQLRSGIKDYEPRPEYGDIYTSTDWGGSDEHSHGWYQWLAVDVEVTMWKSGNSRVIPAGSVVRFAEIYRAQIGNIQLGEMVIAQENEFMLRWPGWRVKERYCDMASLAARLDWRDQLGLDAMSWVKKDFDTEVKMVRSAVGSRYFYIDIPACPWGDKAMRAWRQINGHEVHDWATHPMAEMRYFESNRQKHVREAARRVKASRTAGPGAADDQQQRTAERHAEVGRVTVTRHGRQPGQHSEREAIGVLGVADSPHRLDRGDRVRGSMGHVLPPTTTSAREQEREPWR